MGYIVLESEPFCYLSKHLFSRKTKQINKPISLNRQYMYITPTKPYTPVNVGYLFLKKKR